MTKKWILHCVLSLIIGVNVFANDSILNKAKSDSTKVIGQSEPFEKEIKKTEESNDLKNYIIAICALLGVGITAFVSYKIASKQSKHKLAETKIGILNSKKEKLEKLKNEIYDRQLKLSNTHNDAELTSQVIDRLQQDILSIQKNSELFEPQFVEELKSYNQKITNYIYSAKSGKQLDNESAIRDLSQIPILDEKIKNVISLKLKNVVDQIDNLI
jgi:hypothetical protein